MSLRRLDTADGNLPPTRRLVVAAGLFTAGYAPAALADDAHPITTPGDGLIQEDIHVTGAAHYNLPAFLVRPAGAGRHPCIVVVNEIFGIHAYIKDVCRRLGHMGYIAIAPDYFDRAGDPSTMTDMAQIRPIVIAATYQQVMDDTQGAIDWVKRQSFSNHKFGVTGFCWGGGITWMASAHCPDIKAGVAWYGPLAHPGTMPANDPNRPYPVDIAPHLRTPVLGLYGALDQGITAASVEAMRAALASTGNASHSEIHVYSDAPHGFHADYRSSYVQLDAMDGWGRMTAWFQSNGLAP